MWDDDDDEGKGEGVLLEKHQGRPPSLCRRVWNLIQACDVQSSDQKVYISTSPSSEVENLPPRRGLNPGPAESEADMLAEPARRACGIKMNPAYDNFNLFNSNILFPIPVAKKTYAPRIERMYCGLARNSSLTCGSAINGSLICKRTPFYVGILGT